MKSKPPEKSLHKQDGRFKPGQSGNPAGKKPGTRHKATLAAMALLSGEAEALTRACIDAALGGDMTALKLCLDRIVPAAKDHPFDVKLPKVKETADMPAFTAALLAATAAGQIGITEAEKLSRILSAHLSAMELSEIEKRLSALEGKNS